MLAHPRVGQRGPLLSAAVELGSMELGSTMDGQPGATTSKRRSQGRHRQVQVTDAGFSADSSCSAFEGASTGTQRTGA